MGNFRDSQTATGGETEQDQVEPGIGRSRIAYSNEYYANFVVKPTYERLLGRAADEAGVAYWTSLMHNV